MLACEQCGSINVAKARPAGRDRILSLFSRKRPIVCRRCGWRRRRQWTDDQLMRQKQLVTGGISEDPQLAGLDGIFQHMNAVAATSSQPEGQAAAVLDEFDLASLNSDCIVRSTGDTTAEVHSAATTRPRSRSRRRRSRWRSIAEIATALTFIGSVLLGLVASEGCGLSW